MKLKPTQKAEDIGISFSGLIDAYINKSFSKSYFERLLFKIIFTNKFSLFNHAVKRQPSNIK